MQVSAFQPAVPMGFAASAPSVLSGPLSVLGSIAQHRGVSGTELSEEGEANDDADTTYNPRAGPQSALNPSNADEEPPDLGALLGDLGMGGGDAGRRLAPQGFNMRGYARDDNADPMELLALARDVFTKSDVHSSGLSRPLREALYGQRWDRFLVDCRRGVERTARGKQEIYTSMVATGNCKGMLGLGIGVAETAQLSVARAYLDSYAKLSAFPLYRSHTIYHAVDHSYHTIKLRLMPRPDGWGLACSDLLAELCAVAGIRNLSAKKLSRASSRFFTAQCFQQALLKQSAPHDGAEASGVYAREVYYRRQLPAGLKRGVHVM